MLPRPRLLVCRWSLLFLGAASCADVTRPASPDPELAAAAAPGYTMIELGTLGGAFTSTIDISDRGDVVGEGLLSSGLAPRAFHWRDGVMTDLGTLGGLVSRARGVNNAGVVAGYSTLSPTTTVSHAFLWRDGVMTDLGTLAPGWPTNYAAVAINASGTLLGITGTNGFLWRNGKLTDLGALRPDAFNDAGQVIGRYTPPGGTVVTAFFWDGGAVTQIVGVPGEIRTVAQAINNAGQVVGVSVMPGPAGASRGFVWRAGVATDLGDLGGNGASPTAISRNGSVVGSVEVAPGVTHAFLWRHGILTDLGTLGGTNSVARYINQAGVVVGLSQTATGQSHAFAWKDGVMVDLAPGYPGSDVRGINSRGEIAGLVYTPGFLGTLAVVWRPR